ncbi:hypothetical protein NLJ89_g6453 [Agrocybe chaxingu]|uniref:Membrane-associated proteins in eicosanoid and glutathione metabolism n=1 Tax=Agrocybe chaxingu TaxID=84603 RepID=A0A9W8MWD9_9AGAR|nr:hypothetical protein NLJ89_g6453 [Agrocybe chaxingu]
MSSTVTLPNGFTYVGAALLSTVYLLLCQHAMVNRFRRRAGIKYPQLYAEKAEAAASGDANKFNCAQRAHQNTLENIPIVYVLTLLSGVKYPIFAATTCALWTVSRIFYTRGYITGDPNKRLGLTHHISTAATLSQLAVSTFIAGGWLLGGLASKFL